VIPAIDSDSMASRIARADQAALEESYRMYGPTVRAYLRRFLRPDEVDDVLQVVFLEVWRSRARIDPSRPFEGWLFGIARKRAIDQLRRSSHHVVPVETARELVGPEGEDFADRVAWSTELRAGLSRLPDEQRNAIELSYFWGLTQAEIAHRLGVPIGTVKARMARGMHKLTDMMVRGGAPA
jgi:RNA polymerase sigma factor (sigma-70 family)